MHICCIYQDLGALSYVQFLFSKLLNISAVIPFALHREEIKALCSTEPLWRCDAEWQLSFCCSSSVETRWHFVFCSFKLRVYFGNLCHTGGSNENVFVQAILEQQLSCTHEGSLLCKTAVKFALRVTLQRWRLCWIIYTYSHGCFILMMFMVKETLAYSVHFYSALTYLFILVMPNSWMSGEI